MQNPKLSDWNSKFSLAYEELRRLAKNMIRGQAVRDSSATTLVHLAWIKLAPSELSTKDQLHFKRVVAQAMRYILVDASRRKSTQRRGEGYISLTLDEALLPQPCISLGAQMLDLHAALEKLGTLAPRQAELLEARFFGGMSAEELTEIFEISESTVVRELRFGKAWLARELKQGGAPEA